MGGSIQKEKSSRTVDLITLGCETDVGQNTAYVGPETVQTPEYGILASGGLPRKRADIRGDSSWGGGVTVAYAHQTAADFGRMYKKGENSKYNGPTSGGQTSGPGRDIQEGILGKGEGAHMGDQWMTLTEAIDGYWRVGGVLHADVQPWVGMPLGGCRGRRGWRGWSV